VRVRVHNAESLDEAAARSQRGLRLFVGSTDPIEQVAKRLNGGNGKGEGTGEISIVVVLDDGRSEVEVKLPGRFAISPQMAGAIKSVPGVLAVQEM
jgi:DNA polymerase-3 subunit alpha